MCGKMRGNQRRFWKIPFRSNNSSSHNRPVIRRYAPVLECLEVRRLLSTAVFTINSAQSVISISGSIGGEPIVAQPGSTNIFNNGDSLTTEMSGNISADVESNSITFQGTTTMPALVNGAWYPDDNEAMNTEDADLGGYNSDFNEYLAARGVVLGLSSIAIPMNSGSYSPNGINVTASAGTVYYAGDQPGSYSLAGQFGSNQSMTSGTLTTSGDVETLTVPISAYETDPISIGFATVTVTLTYQGTLTATATVATSPQKLVFATEPTTGTAGQMLSEIDVNVEDQNGDIISGDNSNVTLGVSNGVGSLQGSITAAAQNGVAKFTGVYLSSPGNAILTASDSTDSLSGFTSGQIAVSNPGGLSPSAGASYAFAGPVGEQTLSVTAGTITLSSDLSKAFPGYGLQIQNGSSVVLDSDQHIAGLQLSGTGSLNVNNCAVWIDYGSSADPISSIAAALKSGYNNGSWKGSGIFSTAAAVNPVSYGLGYADSADNGNPANLAADTIEIKYTLLGDANLSGVVDGTDFGIVAANFNKGVTGWDQGDFNYDNVVDGTDFSDLAANFNKGAVGTATNPDLSLTPASLVTTDSDDTTNTTDKTAVLARQPSKSVPKAKWVLTGTMARVRVGA